MGESSSGNGFEKNPQNINRKGRPRKGQSLTEILKGQADCADTKDKKNKPILNPDGTVASRKEVMGHQLWKLALGGYLPAIKYIYDRIDGTPVQTVDMYSIDESMVEALERIHEEQEEKGKNE